MRYSCEVIINLPVERVVRLFDDPANLKLWMPGLIRFEPISGSPGQPGARSRLVFQMGKRTMELVETVVARDLPREFSGRYETNGVRNIVRNHFIPMEDGRTRYLTETEFEFSGFMKVIALLMPGSFRKQSMKYLEAFKSFAESTQ